VRRLGERVLNPHASSESLTSLAEKPINGMYMCHGTWPLLPQVISKSFLTRSNEINNDFSLCLLRTGKRMVFRLQVGREFEQF
jgi:hypothetical protein